MGKYLIAFLALIAALSLSTAYGQVDNQQMRNQQANLTGAGAASVMVNSQELTNGFMTVSRVMIDRPGWVVIHNVQDGMVSGVVGFARVDQEMRDNIRVPVDVNASTENLVAELHYDNGTRGCFEFPGADMPVMVNDRPVMVPFTVTFSQELQQQIQEHRQQTQQMMQMAGQNQTMNQTQMMVQNQTLQQGQMMNQTTEQNQTRDMGMNQTNQTSDQNGDNDEND